MCQTDYNFDFFIVSFSHGTKNIYFKHAWFNIKDKVAKTFLLKATNFCLLLTCLKTFILFKGYMFQLDLKEKLFSLFGRLPLL